MNVYSPDVMYQLVRLAQLIGLNAVPGFGFLSLHWTGGTILILYWIENLIGSVLIAFRIALHRRLTHKRGHYVTHAGSIVTVSYGAHRKKVGTIFASFVLTAFPFTIVEGIFLAVIVTHLPESEAPDLQTLRLGVRLVTALLAAGFLLDLIGMRERPYFWIHRMTSAMVSRVLVLFFVIFIGVGALAFFDAPRPALLVFVVLKTFIDVAAELPESQTGEAPQWQLAIATLFGPNAKARFAAYARSANRDYGTYSPEDEKVMA